MEPSTSSPAESCYRVAVRVFPRREILDPQGKAISSALARLGFDSVVDLRAGKSFELELRAADSSAARAEAEEMCRRLLANPIMEDFEVRLDPDGDNPDGDNGAES